MFHCDRQIAIQIILYTLLKFSHLGEMMRERIKVKIALILTILIAASCMMAFMNFSERASAYSPHGPIIINGNSDFTLANGVTGGSGTSIDPFIIEGWEIDASGFTGGILVSSTDAHFIIRDTFIYSAILAGISFDDVSNGYIDNCSVSNNFIGILVEFSYNSFIRNNTISSNDIGIDIGSSSTISISGNGIDTSNWDGIYMWQSVNCTISDNDISFNSLGIFLDSCDNNFIINNTITDNNEGIFLIYSPYNTCSGNTIMRNLYVGIVIIGSDNLDIMANDIISNNWNGIYMEFSNDLLLKNNNISLNQEVGIWLDNSSDSIIANNTFIDNQVGIDIQLSLNINVTSNSLINNGVNWWGNSIFHYNSHTISSDNAVNGKSLIYYKNSSNIEIDGALIGQLLIANCTDISVKNIHISNTTLGIALAYVENGSIVGNSLTFNECGLDVEYSENISIFENDISNNSWDGIYLEKSNKCNISGNIISYNSPAGIIILTSSNSTINNNNITNNEVGINLTNSVSFQIYHNNFINNIDQAIDDNGNENTWDNGYPSGGNYWADYTGIDSDLDGIGDTPYVIDGDSQDRFPLLNEFIIPEFQEIIIPIIAMIGLFLLCNIFRKKKPLLET